MHNDTAYAIAKTDLADISLLVILEFLRFLSQRNEHVAQNVICLSTMAE